MTLGGSQSQQFLSASLIFQSLSPSIKFEMYVFTASANSPSTNSIVVFSVGSGFLCHCFYLSVYRWVFFQWFCHIRFKTWTMTIVKIPQWINTDRLICHITTFVIGLKNIWLIDCECACALRTLYTWNRYLIVDLNIRIIVYSFDYDGGWVVNTWAPV